MSNAELTLQTGTETREVFRLAPGELLKQVDPGTLCLFHEQAREYEARVRVFAFSTGKEITANLYNFEKMKKKEAGFANPFRGLSAFTPEVFAIVGVESSKGWEFKACRKKVAKIIEIRRRWNHTEPALHGGVRSEIMVEAIAHGKAESVSKFFQQFDFIDETTEGVRK